jgi:regulator of cell morphogenesis and NO signaling
MIMHMQKEEQILFPYIDALEKANSAHGSVEPPFFQTVRNPIHAMMKEHDAAGELVKQIRKPVWNTRLLQMHAQVIRLFTRI